MANIYDGAFRTILNDCRKLIIPVINELSGDVIKEIAQKYENVQKGVGDMMSGALIETSARRLKNEAENETKRNTALRMLKRGKMTIEEIAEDAGLSVSEVEQLAGLQTV